MYFHSLVLCFAGNHPQQVVYIISKTRSHRCQERDILGTFVLVSYTSFRFSLLHVYYPWSIVQVLLLVMEHFPFLSGHDTLCLLLQLVELTFGIHIFFRSWLISVSYRWIVVDNLIKVAELFAFPLLVSPYLFLVTLCLQFSLHALFTFL